MNTFKPGDRVRIIAVTSPDPALKSCIGREGTVLTLAFADSKHDFRPETHDVAVDGVTSPADCTYSFLPSDLRRVPPRA